MTTLLNDKLAWFDLDAAMFPKEVKAQLDKAAEARKVAAIETKKADDMIQTFAPRIQVPNLTGGQRKLLSDGESMVISHRFGKLSVAATTTEKKKAKAEKAATLA
jgi:hypothetical protein